MNIFSLKTCTTLSLHNITWEKQEHENFQEGLTMRRGNITVFSKATLAALAAKQQAASRAGVVTQPPQVTVLYNPELNTKDIMIPGLCGVVRCS